MPVQKELTLVSNLPPNAMRLLGPMYRSSFAAGGLALLRELEDVGPFLVVWLHLRHSRHGIMELAKQCGLEAGGHFQHRQQVHHPELPQRTTCDSSASFGRGQWQSHQRCSATNSIAMKGSGHVTHGVWQREVLQLTGMCKGA